MTVQANKVRRHPRVPTELDVQVKPSRERSMLDAKVSTLSEGGMFLETNKNFAIGNDLMMTFYLPMENKEKYCLVTGRVVWVNRDHSQGKIGCGIAFENCTGSMTKVLHDFIFSQLGGKPDLSNPLDRKKTTRGQMRG